MPIVPDVIHGYIVCEIIKRANLSQFKILCWSVGWLTPETARQTARTADRLEADFARASAITCSNVSLAAVSAAWKTHNQESLTNSTCVCDSLATFYIMRSSNS